MNCLPSPNLVLQPVEPTNSCTKQDFCAHLLITQTAGEELLAFFVPRAKFCCGAAGKRSSGRRRQRGALFLNWFI